MKRVRCAVFQLKMNNGHFTKPTKPTKRYETDETVRNGTKQYETDETVRNSRNGMKQYETYETVRNLRNLRNTKKFRRCPREKNNYRYYRHGTRYTGAASKVYLFFKAGVCVSK